MLAERAIERTREGRAALTAGGSLIARRALSDGRSEYIVYGQKRCVYRSRMRALAHEVSA